jgi:nucleotide-binding universal stress UspA family protein
MTLSNIVVVGVDGSVDSAAALRYAVAEANRRCARLRVVASYAYPEYTALGYATPILVSQQTVETELRAQIRSMVDAELATDPQPPDTEIVVRAGAAAEVLVDSSADADVLVVGHRGRGGFASAMLGSVGLGCVLHAQCPVIVVRPSQAAAEERAAASRSAREAVPQAPRTVAATALGSTD